MLHTGRGGEGVEGEGCYTRGGVERGRRVRGVTHGEGWRWGEGGREWRGERGRGGEGERGRGGGEGEGRYTWRGVERRRGGGGGGG